MKIDIDALAEKAAKFGGLRDSQAAGLAVLLRIVEREAFCDGIRWARGNSFAADPGEVYDGEYSAQAATPPNRKAATKARRQRQASSPSPERTNGKHREQAPPNASIDVAAIDQTQRLEVPMSIPASDPVVGASTK